MQVIPMGQIQSYTENSRAIFLLRGTIHAKVSMTRNSGPIQARVGREGHLLFTDQMRKLCIVISNH